MSLLLLFHNTGAPPHKALAAAAAAGADAIVQARKVAHVTARGGAGCGATSVGVKNAVVARVAAHAGASVRSAAAAGPRTGSAFASAGASGRIKANGRAVTTATAFAHAGGSARLRVIPLRIGVPLARLSRMIIYLDPSPIAITEVGTDEAYPWLIEVGESRLAARAGSFSGIGATESNNVTARIDNTKKRAAYLIGRPIRKRIDIYDKQDLFFSGLITDIEYGTDILFTIEA